MFVIGTMETPEKILDKQHQGNLAKQFIEGWKVERHRGEIWKLQYPLQLSNGILSRSRVPGHTSNTTSISLLHWNQQTEEDFTEDEWCSVFMILHSLYVDTPDKDDEHNLPLRKAENRPLVDDATFLGFLWESMYDVRPQVVYIERAVGVLEHVAAFMLHQKEEEASHLLLSQCKILRLKAGDVNSMTCVLNLPFESLSKSPVSLDEVPPARYRFIDARPFADGTCLRVVETDILPKDRYVAISYVWKGVPPLNPTSNPPQTMAIKSAFNADPISLPALRTACRAAIQLHCPLLWLDGLCIKQGDEDDKAWQIQRMFSIYQHCRVCLILPGGLSRLVTLEEETNWVSRAWTLQEAIAPPRCKVLFSWRYGAGCILESLFSLHVEYVEDDESGAGMAELPLLLAASSRATHLLTVSKDDPTVKVRQKVDINLIVGDNRPGDRVQRNALIGALDLKGKEGMASAIWRAAMMRVAYRPVDMILSIMGMFGVSLDARDFGHDDRLEAALALMREILARGGRAEWLGVIPNLPPGRVLSTTPVILELGEGLEGHFEDKDAMETGLLWWLQGAPTGFVDNDGFVNVTAPVASVTLAVCEASEIIPGQTIDSIRDYQHQHWAIINTNGGASSPPFAVHLGEKKNYLNGSYPTWFDPENNLFMLLDEDGNGGLQVTAYAVGKPEVLLSPGWSTDRTIRVK
ncbi:hypothetical protein QBC41DRAFT_327871 [Cercophora samala]|uniref:Heterokaryon incompatibility domain-containing protein n=1 Tax=Cercophora samala TaxID=330535 RepID=A0AA39Z7A4_9PEZI|nr:hypothetical protein QBC41DRAFT_327871 [Cercophora samala]